MFDKRHGVIFDMDGTLADVRGIRHHVMGKRKDFHKFHSASIDVPANEEVARAARQAHADGLAVLIVTARKAVWRNHTAFWLALNAIPSEGLWMRANHDDRPDREVKQDILNSIRESFHVVHAWDDNPSVIEVWHRNGIPTTTVEGWWDQ